MPIARYQLEDGRIARFEVPKGTTSDQAQAIGQDYFAQQQSIEEPAEEVKPEPTMLPDSDTSSDFIRGIKSYIPGLKETARGAQVGAGLIAQKLGAEETGTELIKSGLAGMQTAQDEQVTKESDTFTKAWDKGIWSVVTDYLPYQAGAGVGNIAESLVASGVGAAIGGASTGGVGAIPGAIAGLVEKGLIKRGIKELAEKVAAEQGEEAAQDLIARESKDILKEQLKKAGSVAGLAAQAGFHGVGEVTGRAAEEAQKEEMTAEEKQAAVENIDMSRLAPSMVAHGVADFFAEKVGLSGLGGFTKASSGNLFKDIMKNIAITGAKEVPPELIQTIAERYGADLSLADAEAMKEYIDTTAASFAMSAMPGAVGGAQVRARGTAEQQAQKAKEEEEYYKQKEVEGEGGGGEEQEETVDIGETRALTAEEKKAAKLAKVEVAKTPEEINTMLQGMGIDPSQQLMNKEGKVVSALDHYNSKIAEGANSQYALRSLKYYIKDTDQDILSDELLKQAEQKQVKIPKAPVELKEFNIDDSEETAITPKTKVVKAPVELKEFNIDDSEETPVVETSVVEAAPRPKPISKEAFNKLSEEEQNKHLGARYNEGYGGQFIIGDKVISEEHGPGVIKTGGGRNKWVVNFDSGIEVNVPDNTLDVKEAQKKKDELVTGTTEVATLPQEEIVDEDLEEKATRGVKYGSLKALDLSPSQKKQIENLKKEGYVPTKIKSLQPLAIKLLGDKANSLKGEELIKALRDRINSDYTPTEQPSAENFLNQTYEGMEAEPARTVEKGIEYAGATEGKHMFDSVNYDGGVKLDVQAKLLKAQEDENARVDELTDQINTSHAAKLELASKDGKISKTMKADLNRLNKEALDRIKPKKFSLKDPLEFMSLPELTAIYKKHVGKDYEKDAPQIETLANKDAFIKSLYKDQKTKVAELADKHFEGEVRAVAFSRHADTTIKAQKEAATKLLASQEKQRLALIKREKKEPLKILLERIDIVANKKLKEARAVTLDTKLAEAEESQYVNDLLDNQERKKAASTRALESTINSKETHTFTEMLNNISNLGFYTNKSVAKGLLQLVDSLSKNGLIPQVNFKIAKLGKGVNGQFDPTTNTITVDGTKGIYEGDGTRTLESVLLHEMMHYLTDHIIDNKAKYIKSIKDESHKARVVAALKRIETNYKIAKVSLGKDFEIGNIKEFIAEVMSNKDFQRALRKIPSSNPFVKAANLLSDIAFNIAKALGFKNDQSSILAESLDDIFNLATVPIEFKGKGISFAKAKGTAKKASTKGLPKSAYDVSGSAILQPDIKRMEYFKHRLLTREGWAHTVHALQNDRYFAKIWEDVNELGGKIIHDPKDTFNNIYTQLTLAQQSSLNLRKKYLAEPSDRLKADIIKLDKLLGEDSIDKTLQILHNFKLGIHGKERRLTKYEMTIELDKDKVIGTKSGNFISPADRRAAITGTRFTDPLNPAPGLLDDPRLTPAQVARLKAEVSWLAKNYAKPLDKMKLDINSDNYNAVGLSAKEEDRFIKDYNDLASIDPRARDLVDKIFKSMDQLNKATETLDKMSGYWSKPVDNWVRFYGWKNYAPLKGLDEHNKIDESFEREGMKAGREFRDYYNTWGGRETPSENSMLQTIADASRAADRAGRKDLTQSIKNAAKKGKNNTQGTGILEAKIEKTISFSERGSLKKLEREMRMLHYNSDGSIDIIKFEPEARHVFDSISRTYKVTHPMWNAANWLTSNVGQLHTRFNYNFAPMNFVRDTLTNAWVIGAEMGPKESFKFLSTVANRVVVGKGFYKAMKVASLYENNDFKALEALAKTDPYIKDMVDLIEHGGKVSYMQGMGIKANYEDLHKIAGKSGIITKWEGVIKLLNIYNETFEIASRSAAFGIVKQRYLNENLKDKGISYKEVNGVRTYSDPDAAAEAEAAASVRAAAYTKNLANFEQVGKIGKEIGAIYMFARPSATGAVRSIEAIAPAMRGSLERAVKSLPDSGAYKFKIVNGVRVYANPDAVTKFKDNYKVKQQNARLMTTMLMAAGMAIYGMSYMMADDDEFERNKTATDNMDQWARFARFHVPNNISKSLGMKDDTVFQLPWGFGLGSFMSAGAQIASVISGNMPLKEAIKNIFLQISLDSFVPIPVSRMDPLEDPLEFTIDSFMPSTVRPLIEFALNKNGLGQDIYRESVGTSTGGEAYNRGDKVPEIYNELAVFLSHNFTNPSTGEPIDITPNSLYFFANSYVDGASRLAELAGGPFLGKKQFDPKLDVPLIGSFFGSASSVDAREFGKMEDRIKNMKGMLKMYESNPEQYEKYVEAHPMNEDLVKIYEKAVGGDLNELYHVAKEYRRMEGLTPSEREALIKPVTLEINLYKHELLQQFKAYGMEPD